MVAGGESGFGQYFGSGSRSKDWAVDGGEEFSVVEAAMPGVCLALLTFSLEGYPPFIGHKHTWHTKIV